MQKNSRKSFDSVGHFSKIHYILHLKFYFRTYYEFQIYYEFQMFNRIQIHTVFKYKLFSLKIVLISSSNSIPIFVVCSPLPPSLIFYSWPCIKNSRRNPISPIIINNIPHLIWEGIKIQTWKIINWTKTNEEKNLQL